MDEKLINEITTVLFLNNLAFSTIKEGLNDRNYFGQDSLIALRKKENNELFQKLVKLRDQKV